jgi:hypothetical protein
LSSYFNAASNKNYFGEYQKKKNLMMLAKNKNIEEKKQNRKTLYKSNYRAEIKKCV